MHKFWIVTKYNLRFLFSNWMSKIFILLISGLILSSSFYYKMQISEIEQNDKVTVSVNDSRVEGALKHFNKQVEIVSKNAEVEIHKKSESTFQLYLEADTSEKTKINLVYGILDSILNPKLYRIEVINSNRETDSLFGVAASLLIYISVLFIGNIVITSVSLEKTSKMLDLISHKVSALTLVYGKCAAVLIYVFLVVSICIVELFVLDYFDVITLSSLFDIININNLGWAEWLSLGLSFLVALLVFMQLYIITALFIEDSSQLQLSQLPMTLLTFSCYSINLLSLIDPNYSYLIDYTKYVPFSFPFGVILKMFVFDNLTTTFLITGVSVSICFVLIMFFVIKKYLLPNKLA